MRVNITFYLFDQDKLDVKLDPVFPKEILQNSCFSLGKPLLPFLHPDTFRIVGKVGCIRGV